MLAGGFLDEVKALRARGDLNPDLPSMRCVGYRQAWEALDGLWPMTELRDKGIFATRQLAKRQITWLRAMPERQVVACDAPDALAQVLALADDFLNNFLLAEKLQRFEPSIHGGEVMTSGCLGAEDFDSNHTSIR
jgi:tRNA dimethylallyltransferase